MDLNKLQILLEANPIQIQDVDWDFKSVTILTKGANTKKRKQDGEKFEDEAQTEVIDPENSPEEEGFPSDPQNKSGDGDGEGSDDTSQEIKIGSIIQDFKTGQYGKVTNIHPNGDVDWVPADEEELRKNGFIASMRLDRSNLNGFIG